MLRPYLARCQRHKNQGEKWAAATHISRKSNTNPPRRNTKLHFFPAARPSKSTRRKFLTATTASRAAFSTFPKASRPASIMLAAAGLEAFGNVENAAREAVVAVRNFRHFR